MPGMTALATLRLAAVSAHGKANTRVIHVLLSVEQINYLRLQAGKRALSVSALLRDLVERDMKRQRDR
jgi:hypothetical protein